MDPSYAMAPAIPCPIGPFDSQFDPDSLSSRSAVSAGRARWMTRPKNRPMRSPLLCRGTSLRALTASVNALFSDQSDRSGNFARCSSSSK